MEWGLCEYVPLFLFLAILILSRCNAEMFFKTSGKILRCIHSNLICYFSYSDIVVFQQFRRPQQPTLPYQVVWSFARQLLYFAVERSSAIFHLAGKKVNGKVWICQMGVNPDCQYIEQSLVAFVSYNLGNGTHILLVFLLR